MDILITKTTVATVTTATNQKKRTIKKESDSEEDGDWENAITVDKKTMNTFEKLFDILDTLSAPSKKKCMLALGQVTPAPLGQVTPAIG